MNATRTASAAATTPSGRPPDGFAAFSTVASQSGSDGFDERISYLLNCISLLSVSTAALDSAEMMVNESASMVGPTSSETRSAICIYR